VLSPACLYAVPSTAGPDKIAFPEKYKDHVLYTDGRPSLIPSSSASSMAPADAVAAMEGGKPLPSGSVLNARAVQGAARRRRQSRSRAPTDASLKGDLIAYTVMEKRTAGAPNTPPNGRNGEWEYAAFGPTPSSTRKRYYKGCFECHKPHESTDYVISHTS
jgi:hypothetical protein